MASKVLDKKYYVLGTKPQSILVDTIISEWE